MPSVTLHIVGVNGQLLNDCEVNAVTSMGYASMHVAAQLGLDDEMGGLFLIDYQTGQQVPDDDIAAKWADRKLVLVQQPRYIQVEDV